VRPTGLIDHRSPCRSDLIRAALGAPEGKCNLEAELVPPGPAAASFIHQVLLPAALTAGYADQTTEGMSRSSPKLLRRTAPG